MLLNETPIFEPSLLQELDWSSNTVPFSPPISPSSPGEGLVLRPLCTADFHRGWFQLLLFSAKKLECYKITLECSPTNVAFYQKFGYTASHETYMQCRFPN
ncbi:hypothetical protein KUCAC02_001949 [Chaenocephalus aceratus]|uniref:Uncharacterized protein n=1 Tax=Chaenocephalus aceratus TaxID=36190 RepID=A0ACB9XUG9_CHAAC|nr:hypothetical protein KUCAC02_001949 [Chaenocephalus aceratus]